MGYKLLQVVEAEKITESFMWVIAYSLDMARS